MMAKGSVMAEMVLCEDWCGLVVDHDGPCREHPAHPRPDTVRCDSEDEGHRCELAAGHDGLHGADFGGSDGFITWGDE